MSVLINTCCYCLYTCLFTELTSLYCHQTITLKARAYGGGGPGIPGNPLDRKTIAASKITYLNKYTIINIATS